MTILSWNCCSISSQARQQDTLVFLDQTNAGIVCLQETWLISNTSWSPPSGWVPLFTSTSNLNRPSQRTASGAATNNSNSSSNSSSLSSSTSSSSSSDNNTTTDVARGQGLAILVRNTLLDQHHMRLHHPIEHNTTDFQLLAASIGSVLVVNVYVSCRANSIRTFQQVVRFISNIRRANRPVLICGDFNHSHHHDHLSTLMLEHLGVFPLLSDTPTRPSSNTAPDNIYFSPVLDLETTGVRVGPQGDHNAIIGRLRQLHHHPMSTNSSSPASPPTSSTSNISHLADAAAQRPYLRINWHKLNPPRKTDVEGTRCHEALIRTLCLAAQTFHPQRDLAGLNDALIALATHFLGVRETFPPTTARWMQDPLVKVTWDDLLRLRRRHSRRKTRGTTLRLNAARKAYRKAKAEAITKQQLATIQKLDGGDASTFLKAYRQQHSPRGSTAYPHLDSTTAIDYWSSIFAREESPDFPPITALPPFAAVTLTFEEEEVMTAISATANKTPGPDGLDARMIKACLPALRQEVHRLFNKALQEGLPPSLKVGRTILIHKKDRTSVDPADYRPITVLPMMTRMFHKAFDVKMRKLITTEGIISENQAGFMPGRSTFRQGMTVNCLTAAARALHREVHIAFLDLEKAFDMISHEALLTVMNTTLRISSQWIEATRLLLMDNKTKLFGQHLPVTRGCLQGSPLSPLLCLLMLEDYTRYMQQVPAPRPIFKGHSRKLPGRLLGDPSPSSPPAEGNLKLLSLLFADDIAIPGDLALIAWALCRTAQWGALRGNKFSRKSRMLTLTADIPYEDSDGAPTYPLFVGNIEIPWIRRSDGIFKYLGMPVTPHPWGTTLNPISKVSTNTQKHRYFLLRSLADVFSLPSGQQAVPPRFLVIGIKVVLLSKALYPAAVIDVDYKALDTMILTAIRRLLGLPKGTPSALLWADLNLWPTSFYGESRALTFLKEFAGTPFFQRVIQASPDTEATFAASGSYARLKRIATKYAVSMTNPTPPEGITWKTHVRNTIREQGLIPCFRSKLESYSETTRQHLSDIGIDETHPTLGTSLPHYINMGGTDATIGLLFRSPALRPLYGHSRPRCHWCLMPQAECGLHLVECPQLPECMRDRLTSILEAISLQDAGQQEGNPGPRAIFSVADRRQALRCLNRLSWRNMTGPLVRHVLRFLGALINSYRDDWYPPPGQTVRNPIKKLYFYS